MDKLITYLEEVKERCRKATREPWTAEGEYISAYVDGGRPNGEVIARMSGSADQLTPAEREANATLAANARTDLTVLVRMIEAILDDEGYPEDMPYCASDIVPQKRKPGNE